MTNIESDKVKEITRRGKVQRYTRFKPCFSIIFSPPPPPPSQEYQSIFVSFSIPCFFFSVFVLLCLPLPSLFPFFFLFISSAVSTTGKAVDPLSFLVEIVPGKKIKYVPYPGIKGLGKNCSMERNETRCSKVGVRCPLAAKSSTLSRWS